MKKIMIGMLSSVIFFLIVFEVRQIAYAAEAADYSDIGGLIYEAEDAELENVEVVQEFYDGGAVKGYSGTGFVGEFDNTDNNPSAITFTIEIAEAGKYDLIFLTCSPYDKKLNHVQIDGGEILHEALESAKSEEFFKRMIEVELKEGTHTIRVTEGWGFMYVDAMVVKKQAPTVPPLYADADPVNPNATPEAKALMAYLNECYGKVMLAGQYAEGIDAPEMKAIYEQTGKYPAIMGLDFLYYGSTAEEYRDTPTQTTQAAIDWWNKGGIVTFCWHWMAPKDNYLSNDWPWNKSFYTQGTNFDLSKVLNGSDPEGYEMLLADIDTVSEELKILQDAGVPVLWRPLHEASGGWFWWGSSGSESYKELWNLMYDRMVNHHGLNNLIWIWNGQHNETDAITEWYPGDDTVDMIGEDIYAEKRDDASQVERFIEALDYTSANKIIALTETGVIPNPDKLLKDGNLWSWFAPWYREFVVDMTYPYEEAPYSDEYTGLNMLRKVYEHESVITLDELPVLNENAVKPLEDTDNLNISNVIPWVLTGILGIIALIFIVLYLKKEQK